MLKACVSERDLWCGLCYQHLYQSVTLGVVRVNVCIGA